jgi:tryptophanyl-tRNA synthetase
VQDKSTMQRLILDQVKAYLAIGLDPEKVTIFKQSDFPEITELSWIFSCISTMPYLMRAHSFKDAEAKDKEINVGVFTYPLLMAADILIQDANVVPVGKDQKQHVEISRDMARKFNTKFGDTFEEPKEYLLESVQTVPGIDGQKMSKNYNNGIPLFASREEIQRLVMKIPTTSAAVEDAKDPDESIIYQIHKLVITTEEDESLRKQYTDGGLGWKEAKDNLLEALDKFIKPMRDKYEEISDEEAIKVIQEGNKKIRPIIEKKLVDIKEKVGLTINN